MLLHAAIYWSEASDLMLWLFVLHYIVDIWNKLPDIEMGSLRLDKFTGMVSDHTDLLNSHVWGCPTYILDPTLQDNGELPGLAEEWLSNQEIEEGRASHRCYVCAFVPMPTVHSTQHRYTTMDCNGESELDEIMAAPKGDSNPPPLVDCGDKSNSDDEDNAD
eukprot:5378442-Ditylum_brightwellii.AAC.1